MLLIVEDHEDTRQMLQHVLSMTGHRVVAVGTATEALEQLETNKPKLMLLDYNLPDMDGLAVLRRVKSKPDLADLPVVIYSAHEGTLRDQVLKEGAAAYLQKGAVDLDALESHISRLLAPQIDADGTKYQSN